MINSSGHLKLTDFGLSSTGMRDKELHVRDLVSKTPFPAGSKAHRERLIRTPGMVLSLTDHLSFTPLSGTERTNTNGSPGGSFLSRNSANLTCDVSEGRVRHTSEGFGDHLSAVNHHEPVLNMSCSDQSKSRPQSSPLKQVISTPKGKKVTPIQGSRSRSRRMNDINEAMKLVADQEKLKKKIVRDRNGLELGAGKQRDSNAMDLDLDRKPRTSPDPKLSSSALQTLPNSSFGLYSDPNKTIPYEHNINSEQDQNDEVFSDKENVYMNSLFSPHKVISPRSSKSRQSLSPPEGRECEPTSPIRTPSPSYLNRILSVDLSQNSLGSTSLSPKINTVKRFSPNQHTVSHLPLETLNDQYQLANPRPESEQSDNDYDMSEPVTESNLGSEKSAASEAIRPKFKSLANLDFDSDSKGSMNLSPKTFKTSPETIKPNFNLDFDKDSERSMNSSPKTFKPRFNLDLDNDSRGGTISSPKTIRPKFNLELDDDSRGSMSSSPINNKVKRFSPNSDSLSPLKPATTMDLMSESRVTSRLSSLNDQFKSLRSESESCDSSMSTPVTGSHPSSEQLTASVAQENMRRLRHVDTTIRPEILRMDSSYQSFDSDIHLERSESDQETVTREEQTQSEMEMSQEEIQPETDVSQFLVTSPLASTTVSSIPKPGLKSPVPSPEGKASVSLKRKSSDGKTQLTGDFTDLLINKKARHDSDPAADPVRSSLSSSSSGSSEEGQGYEASTPVHHSINPLNTPLSAMPQHMKKLKGMKAVKFVSPAGVTPVQHAALLSPTRKMPFNLAELDTSDPATTPTPQHFLSADSPMFKTPQRTPVRTPKSVSRRKSEPTRILGTPDYLAPELLERTDHGKEVDWWALGACLYEFMVGFPPFTDDSHELIFKRIRTLNFEWPEEDPAMSQAARDCILSLLVLDPKDRADDVKLMTETELTRNIDWDNICDQEPPWIPAPDDVTDTTYFHARNSEQGLNVSEYKEEIDE